MLTPHILRPLWQRLGLGVLALACLSIVQAIALGIVHGLSGVNPLGKGTSTLDAALALLGIELITLVVLCVVATRFTAAGLGFTGSWRRSLLLAFPIVVIFVVLPLLLTLGSGEQVPDIPRGPQTVAVFALLALTIGVLEELFFRGVLIDLLGGARAPWAVIFGGALIFGAPHLGAADALINAIAVTLAVGIPFGVIRLAGGNIIGLMAVHALINLYAFTLTGKLTPEKPTATAAAIELTAAAVVAAGYLIWFVRWRRRQGAELGTGIDAPAPSVQPSA